MTGSGVTRRSTLAERRGLRFGNQPYELEIHAVRIGVA
jgi:hypothetical protein